MYLGILWLTLACGKGDHKQQNLATNVLVGRDALSKSPSDVGQGPLLNATGQAGAFIQS